MTLESEMMAKLKGRPKSARDDVAVKIDRALANKAKRIADHRGMSVAELLSNYLQAPVDRGYLAMIRELERSDKK